MESARSQKEIWSITLRPTKRRQIMSPISKVRHGYRAHPGVSASTYLLGTCWYGEEWRIRLSKLVKRIFWYTTCWVVLVGVISLLAEPFSAARWAAQHGNNQKWWQTRLRGGIWPAPPPVSLAKTVHVAAIRRRPAQFLILDWSIVLTTHEPCSWQYSVHASF